MATIRTLPEGTRPEIEKQLLLENGSTPVGIAATIAVSHTTQSSQTVHSSTASGTGSRLPLCAVPDPHGTVKATATVCELKSGIDQSPTRSAPACSKPKARAADTSPVRTDRNSSLHRPRASSSGSNVRQAIERLKRSGQRLTARRPQTPPQPRQHPAPWRTAGKSPQAWAG